MSDSSPAPGAYYSGPPAAPPPESKPVDGGQVNADVPGARTTYRSDPRVSSILLTIPPITFLVYCNCNDLGLFGKSRLLLLRPCCEIWRRRPAGQLRCSQGIGLLRQLLWVLLWRRNREIDRFSVGPRTMDGWMEHACPVIVCADESSICPDLFSLK
uniref:Uncharacterized protein n=1 Tax=Zea mays TaxID=4577 RepID=B6UIG5_MAIZE|nr:hypothetical protein [Zea mays]